jgi:alkyldihydroxyacetonephosphate synthase
LIDNEQYKMGQLFKDRLGVFGSIMDSIKMFYLHSIAGYDEDKLCIAIAVFEGILANSLFTFTGGINCISIATGDKADVEANEKKIKLIAENYQGLSAGASNGKRGYSLTFTIAYIRVS